MFEAKEGKGSAGMKIEGRWVFGSCHKYMVEFDEEMKARAR